MRDRIPLGSPEPVVEAFIKEEMSFMSSIIKASALFLMCFFLSACGAGLLDFTDNLRNGYFFYRTSSINRFIAPEIWNDQTPIIPRKVVVYKSKGGYVTAKREILVEADLISEMHTGSFDYWILNAEKPEVFGPLTKEAFETKLKDQGLSEKLVRKLMID